MGKTYIVRLTDEERKSLEEMVRTGRAAAQKIQHANILLAVDADGPAKTDEKAAEAYHCHMNTVQNVRQRFVEQGLEAALVRKKRETPPRERLLDGKQEARLIAVACGAPPEGRARWTLELLGERMVELNVVESISTSTVRRTLKKMHCNHISGRIG